MNSFSSRNFPFNIILTTISLVGRFLKHFSKLASWTLETLVQWRNSSLIDSSSKLTWKKNTRGTQVPYTNKTKPNKFSISVNLSPSPCLRSSKKPQEPLPLFFTLAAVILPSFFTPATTFVLLKNPKNQCLWSSQKPQPSILSAFNLLDVGVDGCLRRTK